MASLPFRLNINILSELHFIYPSIEISVYDGSDLKDLSIDEMVGA